MDFIKQPMEIENRSMEIIAPHLEGLNLSPEQVKVYSRLIHAAGDVDYAPIIKMSADAIEQALNEVSPKFEARQVTEFQVMAWTLPTEAGFYYMRDLRHTNPLEVGLDRGIGWDKDFIGKDALLKIREEGPAREMVGFTVEEADIHINGKHLGGPGEAVCVDGEEVGRVSKIVYGYVKDTNIGYILAKKGSLKVGDHVSIHGHEAVITEKSFL